MPLQRVVVFDLGGVLIDWNPRYLYRKVLPEAEVERFLAEVCTQAWNERQDAGRTVAEATAELVARFPDQEALVRAYYDRWDEMLGGLIEGTAAIVEELAARGEVELYALSNWSSETFHHARGRYAVLERFRAILVSGEERLIKPDPRFFELLFTRHGVAPARAIFIDDVERNVEAARRLGMTGIRFDSPAQLRAELVRLGAL